MRFEHMTFCSQNRRATGLRYIPKSFKIFNLAKTGLEPVTHEL